MISSQKVRGINKGLNKQAETNRWKILEAINVFNSASYLEPKCLKCEAKIDYGPATTEWDETRQALVCKNCKTLIK